MKVLIVDDEQVSRMVLERTLRAMDYRVDVATSGADAWELYQAYQHAIVIADWVMPGIDGIKLCELIRGLSHISYSYVVLLTSKYEKQDRLTGLKAGADDFITKPFDRAELRARLGVAERIVRMEMELRTANDRLEEKRKQEIEIGGNIQRSLLMARPPEDVSMFEFAPMNLPSSQVDGDFFDFFVHRPEIVDVFIGDAMGKGIAAALIGAGSKTTLLRSIGTLLSSRTDDALPSPREIVQHAHRTLASELMRLDSFITLEYARFDAINSTATFVDCGHTKIVQWDSRANEIRELSGNNFPIGFVTEETYGEFVVPIAAGDLFCIYSDGVTEAQSPDRELFGIDRLKIIVSEYAAEAPSQILYRLRESIRKHTQDAELQDDFTVVVVKVGPVSREWQHQLRVFASRLESLSDIRQYVGSLALDCGIPLPRIDELQLAVHEATTNIIEHAHGKYGVGEIEVYAERSAQGLAVKLMYEGPAFVPPSDVIDQPTINTTRDGGFGLFIIQEYADQVNYGCEESGLQYIRLVKNRA
jgi:sigma-B regulation protein RsbU (phosphoserine phosphatase)